MLRNIFSNWVAIVIIGAVAFLMTPLLIHHLGNLEFGIWVLVSSICGYSGLLEFGLRTTLQRYVARFRGLNDRESLNQVFMSALVLTIASGSLIFVIMSLFAWVLPGFFGLQGERRHDFAVLLVVMGGTLAITLVSLLLKAYLCGWQRFELYNLNVVAFTLVQAAAMVCVLHQGHGVVALGVVAFVTTLCFLPLDWKMVRHVDAGLRLNLRSLTPKRIRELLEFGMWMFFNSMGIRLRTYTDSIVIGRILNVALITPFSVAGRLMQYFEPAVNSIVSPMLPVMSELDGQGRHGELQSFFLQATKLTTAFTLLIGSILVLDSRLLLRVWVGEEFDAAYILVLILLVGYVLELAQRPSIVALISLGRHRALGSWTLGEGVANLILSVYLGYKYGLVGVALGTTIPLLVVKLTLQPWYTLRMLGLSARAYIQHSLARPIMVCALFLVCAYALLRMFPPSGIFGLVGALTVQVMLFGLLTWVLGLSAYERSLLWQRSRRFISNRELASVAEVKT
jgi:O-antigen/teichoic acid export membrane protein